MGKTGERTSKVIPTIGNLLIGLSVVFALTIFYPIIKEEYKYRTGNVYIDQPLSTDFNVRIPSLGINVPVIKDVDPWSEIEYRASLKNGVAHAKGSALPGEDGTVYLFAHSSDFPWRMTHYNTAFFRLGRVKEGDEVIITYEGNDYLYLVREKQVVWPKEVEYLTTQDQDQLILQTCTPIGTSLKRLLVFAAPSKPGLVYP